MSKSLLAALALAPLAVTGCMTNDTPVTPLAQLAGAKVQLQTDNDSPFIANGYASPTQVTIEVPGACPRIGEDVTVDLDGVRARSESLGGEQNYIDGSECVPIIFDVDQPVLVAHSTLLVRDANTTWTIEGSDLFANDFVVEAPPVAGDRAHLVWRSAQQIDNGVYAEIVQHGNIMVQAWMAPAVTTAGNAIDLAIPADVTGDAMLSINASRNATATRCDGPATCVLRVGAGSDLAVTIATAMTGPDAALPAARR